MKKTSSESLAIGGVFVALSLILGYVESLIPIPIPVPGIKIGLANITSIVCFYVLDIKFALTTAIIRIILSALLFGNAYSFAFSIAGGVLSLLVMSLMFKTEKFSCIGVSIGGGVSHNIGQIVIASILLGSKYIIGYLPVLIIGGLISGMFIGLVSAVIINRLRRWFNNGKNKG